MWKLGELKSLNHNLGLRIKSFFRLFLEKPIAVLGLYFGLIASFALVYWLGEIKFSNDQDFKILGVIDSFYFSVVTITTLGYGDISPYDEWGKFFTALESVAGILTLGLFLNSLSHRLAIRYQEITKRKESEIAIKLTYVPNINDFDLYYWHLTDVFEPLRKVQLLRESAKNLSAAEMKVFTDSIEAFKKSLGSSQMKFILEDRASLLRHAPKLESSIDPVSYKSLLTSVHLIQANESKWFIEKFLSNVDQILKDYSLNSRAIDCLSVDLSYFRIWLAKELKAMTVMISEVKKYSGLDTSKLKVELLPLLDEIINEE